MSHTRQNKKRTQTLESAQYGLLIHFDGLDYTDDTSISPYYSQLSRIYGATLGARQSGCLQEVVSGKNQQIGPMLD